MPEPKATPFKYYIHDRADSFRMQLFGDFTGACTRELSGCWATAKDSVSKRKLVVDIRGLKSMDQAGREWIALMTEEGATVLSDARGPSIEPETGELTKNRSGLVRRFVRQEQ